jgi:hypothetical protein
MIVGVYRDPNEAEIVQLNNALNAYANEIVAHIDIDHIRAMPLDEFGQRSMHLCNESALEVDVLSLMQLTFNGNIGTSSALLRWFMHSLLRRIDHSLPNDLSIQWDHDESEVYLIAL